MCGGSSDFTVEWWGVLGQYFTLALKFFLGVKKDQSTRGMQFMVEFEYREEELVNLGVL